MSAVLRLCSAALVLAGCASDRGTNPDATVQQDAAQAADAAPALQCNDRCWAKARACGAPSAIAMDTCTTLVCRQDPSEAELECLEASDCAVLLAAYRSGATVCGISLAGPDGGA